MGGRFRWLDIEMDLGVRGRFAGILCSAWEGWERTFYNLDMNEGSKGRRQCRDLTAELKRTAGRM